MTRADSSAYYDQFDEDLASARMAGIHIDDLQTLVLNVSMPDWCIGRCRMGVITEST